MHLTVNDVHALPVNNGPKARPQGNVTKPKDKGEATQIVWAANIVQAALACNSTATAAAAAAAAASLPLLAPAIQLPPPVSLSHGSEKPARNSFGSSIAVLSGQQFLCPCPSYTCAM